ncbi:MAG TPA: VanW family protein [Polyangiaceae bacterium]
MSTETAARPRLPERIGKGVRTFFQRSRTLAGRISRRQRRTIAAGLGVLVLLSPGVFGAFAPRGEVVGGVRALGLDVSRMSERALAETIEKRARALETRALRMRIGDKPLSLDPRALGFRIDTEKARKRAFSVGREGSVLARIAGVYARLFRPVAVETQASFRVEELTKLLSEFESSAISDRPFAGGIKLDGAKVEAVAPRAGRKLDAPRAVSAIRRALLEAEPGVVELPVVTVPAELPPDAAEEPARQARALVSAPITLVAKDPEARVVLSSNQLGAAISTSLRPPKILLDFAPERLEAALAEAKKGIEREAVDARFEIDAKETITIAPSRPGLRVDMAGLRAALESAAARPDRTGGLPLLEEPKPGLTTEEAEHLGIKGLVSSFTTRHPCCEKRVENIHRIADIMNGRVVRPGETVSVNAIVGPRTAKSGFVMAPTIEEGEMVDSIGGGISQFATTFFNALFHGGYEIIERQPHTYWFPRYPMGHEATLSWPKPDIIFKNDTAAGMVFKTSYTGTSITVKIYGDNGGRKVRAEVSGRQNVIDAPIEILPNPHVPPDEEKIKEPGSVGWSVIVSRFLTFPDGTKREDRRRVTYKPRPKRVEVHPCRIPKGEKGYTGERCPEPEDVEEIPETP